MPRPPACSCDHKKVISEHNSGRGLLSEKVPATEAMGISETVATKLAVDALDKYKDCSLPLAVCPVHGPDLFTTSVQLFDVFDKHLFRGVLKGEVYLKWVRLPSDIYGVTSNSGVKDTRITIELNEELQYAPEMPPDVFFSIMIHHMTHAYFLACCGLREEDNDSEKYGLGHGLAFCTLLYKLTRAFNPKTRRPLNPFNCCRSDSTPPSARIMNCLQLKGKPRAAGSSYCSFLSTNFLTWETCHDHIKTLQDLNLSKQENITPFPMSHYLHTVDLEKSKFEPILRKRYPSPPTEYVELHYSNYAVAISRSKLDDYPSLKSKFSENSNTLAIPAPSPSIFFSFYIFLHNGDYPPELVQTTSPYITATAASGPPSIAAYFPEASNYAVVDVRMFKLASRLGFSEMQNKALKRMYSLHETHSDPVILLEEIYNDNDLGNKDDKNELRKWARDFLARGCPGSGLTNMAILQQSEQWKDRFISLRRDHGILNFDCNEVTESLILRRALERIEGGKGEKSSKDKGKEKEKEKKKDKDKGDDDSAVLDLSRSILLDLAIKNNSKHSLEQTRTAMTQPQLIDCLTSASLSPAELQFLRLRHPSISALYEKVLEKGKKDKGDKEKDKDKPKDKKDKDEKKDKDKDKDAKGKGKEKEASSEACDGGCSHHHHHYRGLRCHQRCLEEQACIGDKPCWYAHGRGSPFLINQNPPMPYPNGYHDHDQNMNYYSYPYGHSGQR